jgi:hypothetical protein
MDPSAKGHDQEDVVAAIADDARLAAEERLAQLQGLAETLGKPPKEIAAIVKKSGLDPRKLAGGDLEQRARFEELVREAREAAGDRAVKAELLASPLFDPGSPFAPAECGAVRRRRTGP